MEMIAATRGTVQSSFIKSLAVGAVCLVGNAHVLHYDVETMSGSLNPNVFFMSSSNSSGSTVLIHNTSKTNIELTTDKEQYENGISYRLDFIKQVFSLSDEEMALALDKVRKTIHNWRQHGAVKAEGDRLKLFNLYILAKNWENHGYTQSKVHLETPVLSGQSIKQLILANDFDENKVLFAGSCLNDLIDNTDNLF